MRLGRNCCQHVAVALGCQVLQKNLITHIKPKVDIFGKAEHKQFRKETATP